MTTDYSFKAQMENVKASEPSLLAEIAHEIWPDNPTSKKFYLTESEKRAIQRERQERAYYLRVVWPEICGEEIL